MEQNTIQIQHINLECPIAEFGFNRFLLTFFIRYRVLNSNAFRPGIGPQRPLRSTALSSITSGSPNCWTSNRPAWSKIEGRLQKSKYWNLLIRTARWVVSQTNVLQRSNTRAIFHNIFIDMCRLVSFSRWPPEPSNQHLLLCSPAPAKQHVTLSPLQFLLPYQLIPNTQLLCMCVGVFFPLHLGTECSHSVYFFVFYVLVASSNCPSVVFLCTQGYLHTHHSTMYQKTHQLQLIALYSQQAL